MVISGPSGAGKDALIDRLKERYSGFYSAVTATTRVPRDNEQDGVHYHFLSEDSFRSMIERDELLEWALVYGNYYGVPKREVREALRRGEHVILRVDVQGALSVRELVPDALLFFVNPPTVDALRNRLRERGTNHDDMEVRLDAAHSEIGVADRFDFQITNRDGMLDDAVARVVEIVESESCEGRRRVSDI